MRIAQLDLHRYGRFTDVHLALPRSESDFHIIFGPNEAGKSTTRNALAELLYGFEKSTPYNFIHDYSDLRLGARVESDPDAIDVVRLKRNKNPLVDAADQAIDPDAWRRFIGATDRAFFERMFALDHEELVRGGRLMLDSSSEVGRTLFQAASGLSHFSKIRSDLGTEARGWWDPNAKKDVRYFIAKARLDEAVRALKEHALSEAALKTLQTTCTSATSRANKEDQLRNVACARAAQLERIRRVAPKLQQLAVAEAESAAARENVLLPADARETFRLHTMEMAKADNTSRLIADAMAQQIERRATLVVDDLLLDQADEIDALAHLLSGIARAATDLPKRVVEREQLRRDIHQGLHELSLKAMEPGDVHSVLLNVAQREHLRELAETHTAHAKTHASLKERESAATLTRDQLRDELGGINEAPTDAWGERITAADAVLESANGRQLAVAVITAEKTLKAAIEALKWSHDPAALQALTPPDGSVPVSHLAEIASVHDQRQTRIRFRQDAEVDLKQIEAEIAAGHGDAVPDAAALTAARTGRDNLLNALIAGERTLHAHGGELRQQVDTADDVADRRYAEAQKAATIDGLIARREGLRARIEALSIQIDGLDAAERAVRDAWATTLTAAGFPSIALEASKEWFEARQRALASHGEAERTRATLLAFNQDAMREAERLAALLGRTPPEGVAASDWLRALLVEARRAQQDAAETRTRRAERLRLIEQQDTLIAKTREALAELEATVTAWNAAWRIACEDARLPSQTLPRSLPRVLETIESVRTKAGLFTREQEQRILPMERDVKAYEERVRNCVAKAAHGLSPLPFFDAVRRMASSLQSARQAQQASVELDRSIADQEISLANLTRTREAALANLEPLRHQAGVETLEQLDVAISGSDLRRTLEASQTGALNAVLEHGGGLNVDQLRNELDSVAVDQLDALLQQAHRDEQEAEARRLSAQEEAVLAKEKLRQREGSDSAARAQSAKAMAQREMADAAETYIGLRTQSMLLDWALTRYREEKQAPLLKRASDYFSELTCGEHVRLMADGEGAAVTLSSRRSGPASAKVPVEGMSDGTRDQLFLALRLAAIELHLKNNVSLPFIADDLLVNFDDTRAKAALRSLATLAKRTQTLYFTHHRHVVDLARDALGSNVNVVDLVPCQRR